MAAGRLNLHTLPGFPNRQVVITVAQPPMNESIPPVDIGRESSPLDSLTRDDILEGKSGF